MDQKAVKLHDSEVQLRTYAGNHWSEAIDLAHEGEVVEYIKGTSTSLNFSFNPNSISQAISNRRFIPPHTLKPFSKDDSFLLTLKRRRIPRELHHSHGRTLLISHLETLITMKPSTILFIATQITLALSRNIAGPDFSAPPDSARGSIPATELSKRAGPDVSELVDDGRGSIPATELGKRNSLFARDCPRLEPYGCSKNSCWRTCGRPGEWCWLAASGGSGPWIACNSASECSPDATPGTGCGLGDCDACGCGC